jgi:hypothetical protein
MHRFWEIVEPILERIGPRTIIEIGAGAGANTKNLLTFCEGRDCVLHSIDPAPAFDVAAFERHHAERFVFHARPSLEVLPGLPCPDAVLIDGDHNWFTVINELRLVADASRRASRPFPVVMLHDVGWPYGRRDLYYAPERVPDEYRHPFARKGIAPGRSELVERGGVNPELCNATIEGTPRNGVLTAVEDFLTEARVGLAFTVLPGFHGLGILHPDRLAHDDSGLGDVGMSPPIGRHVTRLEEARVRAVEELSRRAFGFRAVVTLLEKRIRDLEARLGMDGSRGDT